MLGKAANIRGIFCTGQRALKHFQSVQKKELSLGFYFSVSKRSSHPGKGQACVRGATSPGWPTNMNECAQKRPELE